MSFAEKLRAAMQRAGISQSELARRLGIRSQAVNQWLAPGGTAPRGARLHQVATALNVGLADLLADSNETQPADQSRADLLAAYDVLDEEQRQALLMMAKVMQRTANSDSAPEPPAKPEPPRRRQQRVA